MTLAERFDLWALQYEQRGIEKGIEKGEALLLQRLLARRFGQLPPDLIQRISQATAAEIELWGDRVLDAGSLDEVFSG
ncbi:DUF4351 domain-containing protein [Rhodocyclus purpureus]|uniref:DUF4351 domain-containing protein n=1 Tax=Rhodocyclus purpureus TaxID=1067 RepID=UPI001912377A|nr:DUF4351 domain-containing protein [Rhodocyclus purpureus]